MKYAAAPWRCRHDNRLEWLPGRGLKTDTESCEEEDRITEVRKRSERVVPRRHRTEATGEEAF